MGGASIRAPARGNTRAARIAGAVFVAALAATARGETYYVDAGFAEASDSSPGTAPDTPWRTLEHAMQAAAPGDTVWVKDGRYGGCSASVSGDSPEGPFPAFVPKRSGTAAARIEFRAHPGHRPTLECFIGGGGKDYITWSGFRMDDRGVYISVGPNPDRTAGLILENMDIRRRTDLHDPGSGNYYCIYLSGASGPIVRDNVLHDTNYVEHTDGNGVILYLTNDAVIEHNLIHGTHRGVLDKNSGERNIVRYNYIRDVTGSGLEINGFGCPSGEDGWCGHSQWHHNVVDGAETGFRFGSGKTIHFQGVSAWNNTIHDVRRCMLGGTLDDFEFYNNICWTRSGGEQGFRTEGKADGFAVMDFNQWTHHDQRFIEGLYGSEQRVLGSLSAWREATGHDTHSVASDPRFADAEDGDFRLAEDSPSRGAGRVQGDPEGARVDHGAYEDGDETIGPRPTRSGAGDRGAP